MPSNTSSNNKNKPIAKRPSAGKKPKLTKEERRTKYTQLARQRQSDHQARRRAAHLTCFHCREKGHTLQQCPKRSTTRNTKQCCFKCGATAHALFTCPQLPPSFHKSNLETAGELPYATCFICDETGHLASTCPKNSNGIYVSGDGCCKLCGSKQHRASDCTEKKTKNKREDKLRDGGRLPEWDDTDLVVETNMSDAPKTTRETKQEKKKKRVVKF